MVGLAVNCDDCGVVMRVWMRVDVMWGEYGDRRGSAVEDGGGSGSENVGDAKAGCGGARRGK